MEKWKILLECASQPTLKAYVDFGSDRVPERCDHIQYLGRWYYIDEKKWDIDTHTVHIILLRHL